MTEIEFYKRLRADGARELEMVETVTRLLQDDIRDQTLERRVALRRTIREFDMVLSRSQEGPAV